MDFSSSLFDVVDDTPVSVATLSTDEEAGAISKSSLPEARANEIAKAENTTKARK